MDTRVKIQSWEKAVRLARGHPGVTIVTGYFDPLLAAHARKLADLARRGQVLAIVVDPERPLLEARARAELLAALDSVAWAAIAPKEGFEEWAESLPAARVVREEKADRQRSREFADHIHKRSAAAKE